MKDEIFKRLREIEDTLKKQSEKVPNVTLYVETSDVAFAKFIEIKQSLDEERRLLIGLLEKEKQNEDSTE